MGGSSWSYYPKTRTVLINTIFNGELSGLPVDTKVIRFKEEVPYDVSQFNQPIKKNNLPPNVQRIEFGWHFNQPISQDSLPENLTHLSFGSNFDQPINRGSLPNSLTHLSFDYSFNQPISEGTLPVNLTYLSFGYCFRQPISEDMLPNSLTHLTVGSLFNQSLDMLPANLTHLSIENPDYSKTLNNLPCSLKILEISKYYPTEKIKLPFGCKVITEGI
jgi:hypothetical protein